MLKFLSQWPKNTFQPAKPPSSGQGHKRAQFGREQKRKQLDSQVGQRSSSCSLLQNSLTVPAWLVKVCTGSKIHTNGHTPLRHLAVLAWRRRWERMAFLATIFHVCLQACLTLENEMAAGERPRDQYDSALQWWGKWLMRLSLLGRSCVTQSDNY